MWPIAPMPTAQTPPRTRSHRGPPMTRCASQLALLLLFPARWLAYHLSAGNLSQGQGSALP